MQAWHYTPKGCIELASSPAVPAFFRLQEAKKFGTAGFEASVEPLKTAPCVLQIHIRTYVELKLILDGKRCL